MVAGSDTDNVTAGEPGAFTATIPPAALPHGSTMGFEMRSTQHAVAANRRKLAAIVTGHTQTAAKALRLLPSSNPNKAIRVALERPKAGGGPAANGSSGEPSSLPRVVCWRALRAARAWLGQPQTRAQPAAKLRPLALQSTRP